MQTQKITRPGNGRAEIGACSCGQPPVIVTPPPGTPVPGTGRVPPPLSTWVQAVMGDAQSTATDYYTRVMQPRLNMPCRPYENEVSDCLYMVPVASDVTTVAPGASQELTISPRRGWLDGYYFDIVGFDPATGLQVDPASFRITPPRVADCPQPQGTTALRGVFWQGLDGCCCGRPFRAIVGRSDDGEAMTFTLTNDGPASANFQAIMRGYEYARSLCV